MPHLFRPPGQMPIFPNELLYTVILRVIGNGIHAICLSPDNVDWEINMLRTLCSVSYNFRAVTMRLTRKAFNVEQGDDISRIFLPIENQLRRLHGLNHYSPTRSSLFRPLPKDDALLTFGYSFYLSAINVLKHPKHSILTFYPSHELAIHFLSMSLNICAKVEPCGIADLLAEAMAKALVFLGTGLDMVRASERLDCLLSLRENLETSDEVDDPQARLENETQIRKEISKIECANALYFETAASDAVYRPSQLPGLLPVLEKLRGVDFLVAEVPMKVKLGELVKRWSAVV